MSRSTCPWEQCSARSRAQSWTTTKLSIVRHDQRLRAVVACAGRDEVLGPRATFHKCGCVFGVFRRRRTATRRYDGAPRRHAGTDGCGGNSVSRGELGAVRRPASCVRSSSRHAATRKSLTAWRARVSAPFSTWTTLRAYRRSTDATGGVPSEQPSCREKAGRLRG